MQVIRDRKKILETMLVLTVAAVAVHFIFNFKTNYALYIALGLGLTGLFLPWVAMWITTAWMGLAEILGKISSTVVLTLLFFLILFPSALLKKLFGKQGTYVKKKKDGSYFQERNVAFTKEHLENPW